METYIESPYRSFEEENLGDLVGKEFFFVALGAADNTIKLAADGESVIGVLHERTSMESKDVSVRLLGKGGTVKVKAGGIIAKGGRVIWGAGAKALPVPAVDGTYRTFGRKLSQGNSANNDVIEIIDVIEPITLVGE